MANKEQLAILRQGVEVWNKWRVKNTTIEVDLSGSLLNGADLSEADLSNTYLFRTFLRKTNLSRAILNRADLRKADLHGANLTGTILRGADLQGAKLTEVNLKNANLRNANLSDADLRRSSLNGAELLEAVLSRAKLRGTNFSLSKVGFTDFGTIDLREAIGLNNIYHSAPSEIATTTFARSRGMIPEVFLRGCGLNDWEIEGVKLYNPETSNDEVNTTLYKIYDLRATQALQVSPLFISYSHGDNIFVDKLENHLNKKGVRFWRDVHDAVSGKLEKQIDRAIRLNPIVILVLSKHSLKSDWVRHEVRTARQLEKDMERDVLCPVALDDSWKSSPWPKRIMEQIMEYNILDFSTWEDDSKFEDMFRKLIDGLELFYKG